MRTDVGVDLLCDAADRDAVREALLRGAARSPCREAGRGDRCASSTAGPRYGIDLDETVIPQEAGLNERAVSFTKGCYVGQETVARLYYRGKPNRHLRGLRLSAPAEPGAELRLGERAVGPSDAARSSPRATARSAWRSCAARPSRERPSPSASDGVERRGASSCRSVEPRVSLRERRAPG